jgi:hypothetical protein
MKTRSPPANGARYLVLVDALDGDAVAGRAVNGGEGVPELAVPQQLAERVPRLEVLVVAEVGPLAAGHDPAALLLLPLPRRRTGTGAGPPGGVRGGGAGAAEAHRRGRRLPATGAPATINGVGIPGRGQSRRRLCSSLCSLGISHWWRCRRSPLPLSSWFRE